MESENVASKEHPAEDARERFFTVDSANEALVLVRKVVRDTVDAYNELTKLRTEQQELALAPGVHEQLEVLRAQIEQQVDRLKRLAEELTDVGCELKDSFQGLVDFPALHAGRKVLLCWKLGEPEVAYWHELRAGFAGRQPIDAAFRRRAAEPIPVGADTTGPR